MYHFWPISTPTSQLKFQTPSQSLTLCSPAPKLPYVSFTASCDPMALKYSRFKITKKMCFGPHTFWEGPVQSGKSVQSSYDRSRSKVSKLSKVWSSLKGPWQHKFITYVILRMHRQAIGLPSLLRALHKLQITYIELLMLLQHPSHSMVIVSKCFGVWTLDYELRLAFNSFLSFINFLWTSYGLRNNKHIT